MRTALIALALLAAPPSATQALQQRDQEIRAALPPQGVAATPALHRRLEQAITQMVDIDGIAKAALGKFWDRQPQAKRQRFLQAFTKRFKRAATDQLDFFRSAHTKFDLEQPLANGDVKVPTELTVKGEPTHVDYVLRRVHGAWKIEDIVIDDLSTLEDYRSAFARVIDKHGFDGLIERLSKAAPKGADRELGRGGSGGTDRP